RRGVLHRRDCNCAPSTQGSEERGRRPVKQLRAEQLLPLGFAIIATLGILLPLSMALTISLNPDEQDILVSMGKLRSFLPAVVSLQNYIEFWTDPVHPFARYLFNTVLISSLTLTLSIVLNSMAAFVLA